MVKRFLLNNVCDECGMVPTDEPRGFVSGQDYDALAFKKKLADSAWQEVRGQRNSLMGEVRRLRQENDAFAARLAEAERLLRMCRDEFNGLPHSLGYDFTHTPKLDAFLGASVSATPASSGDATKAMLAGSASGVQE
jgi:hypothetical protein